MNYPAHRTDVERFSDDLSMLWIQAVLAEAEGNLNRYQAAVAEDAPEQQIEAALDYLYEHLRAKLSTQQLIRAVLLMVAVHGAPGERP